MISLKSTHGQVITYPFSVISSHTSLGMRFLIQAGVKIDVLIKGAPDDL